MRRLCLVSCAAALLALACAGACGERARPAEARTLGGAIAEQMKRLPAPHRAPGEQRGDKRRQREPAVYVDGRPQGVLRVAELPPTLRARTLQRGGREVTRYRMAEYIAALGVPLPRLRAAYLVGGRGRIAVVPGDELRAHADTLLFAFTRGDAGKPRMDWPREGIRTNTTIDAIAGIWLFVDKEPPRYDASKGTLTLPDGTVAAGVPYATEEIRGARLYHDGRLLGALHRKTLPERLRAGGEQPARVPLVEWMRALGADPQRVRAAEIVSGEDVIARLDAAAWRREQASLQTSLPDRATGRILLHLPPEDAAVRAAGLSKEASVPISAIVLHEATAPSDRPVAPLPSLPGPEQPGSSPDHAADEAPRMPRPDGAGMKDASNDVEEDG
jgi:hypothetical protein